MNDPFHLSRFVEAQSPVYAEVCAELRKGAKVSHWMWFIFPQLQGLGQSYLSKKFALASLEEAAAYVEHPVLGIRLRECSLLVNQIQGRNILEIFGAPDDRKFWSCMSLFSHATKDNKVFLDALQKYFSGEYDPLTITILGG